MQKVATSIWVLLLPLFLPLVTNSQPQPPKAKFRLLIYGFPYFEMEHSENTVGKKWGIEFLRIADCMVTQEFVDSVDKQNEKTESRITVRYGKNWRKQFDQEVGVELNNRKVARALVDQIDYIKEKQTALEKENNGLDITLTVIPNTTRYIVLVQGWGKWQGKDEWVAFYKLQVDYKAKTVQVLNDKIMKGRP